VGPCDVPPSSGAHIDGSRNDYFLRGFESLPCYRLVVMVRYDKGLMFVKFVGTHSQYDKIDAVTV